MGTSSLDRRIDELRGAIASRTSHIEWLANERDTHDRGAQRAARSHRQREYWLATRGRKRKTVHLLVHKDPKASHSCASRK